MCADKADVNDPVRVIYPNHYAFDWYRLFFISNKQIIWTYAIKTVQHKIQQQGGFKIDAY